MQKTKIEWCDYTINPVKGLCPVACDYCYARRIYKRYHWEERLTYHDEVFEPIKELKKPGRIFVGSTIDLFHDNIIGVFPRILEHVKAFPTHTFIFLTKCPHNLPTEWPDNCWVGVSAVDKLHFYAACHYLATVRAKVKFISFEPLLSSMQGSELIHEHFQNGGVNWVIVGQQTPVSKRTMPCLEWVTDIIRAAEVEHIPVFLKDNLRSIFGVPIHECPSLCQEYPVTS